jgi:hypothetical protein
LVLCHPGCEDKLRKDEALPFQRFLVAKVNEVTDRLARDSRVIEKLGFMFGRKLRHRLQFDDQPAKDKEVGDVTLLEFPAFVEALELYPGAEGNPAQA